MTLCAPRRLVHVEDLGRKYCVNLDAPSVFFFWKNVAQIYDFLPCRGCVYKYILITPRQNKNLWITHRVAPCGNRTRYKSRLIRSPSYRTNREVNFRSSCRGTCIN
ncbi:hypothetical protein SFRURICE_012020 [Spodoptera frugiperda]|nr:hypothetical protein SFRURICE_012020 [Spodoptera frugiperda]